VIFANKAFVMNETNRENPPTDRDKDAEQTRNDRKIGTNEVLVGRSERDTDERHGENEGDEDLRPQVANVFFEDVEDLAHASLPFWADE
jgi:hypothetical protein